MEVSSQFKPFLVLAQSWISPRSRRCTPSGSGVRSPPPWVSRTGRLCGPHAPCPPRPQGCTGTASQSPRSYRTCAARRGTLPRPVVHSYPPEASDRLFVIVLHADLHGRVAGHVGAQDVPDEAGHDHPGGGAALAHLTVEHARRVGIGPLQLSQHRVEITFSWCLLVDNRHPGRGQWMIEWSHPQYHSSVYTWRSPV